MIQLYSLLLANILFFHLFFQPADPAGICGSTLHTITPFRGISNENKIVGGVDVGYYKYPWYVALMNDGNIFCGGTLISNRYVVSAAHCYDNYIEQASAGIIKLENVLTPIFGVYNICDTKELTHKRNRFSKVFIHENYKKNGYYFDISLLKLKRKANGFEPICMPTHVYTSDQRPREGLITGLGSQMYPGNTTCALREARILIYPDEVCKKILDNAGAKVSELTDAFCAGYLQGGIDACQGDSGGPLMILGHDSKLTLLGVVSFGQECAKPRRLGVYTDVSKYLDWIYNKMKRPRPTNKPTESSTTPTSPVTPTTPSSQPTTGYHPSTYMFPTDVITSMSTTKRPRPIYEYNRPIIIIINKKSMQKQGRQ